MLIDAAYTLVNSHTHTYLLAIKRTSAYDDDGDGDNDEWASTTTREVFHTGAGFGEAGVVPTSPSSGNMPSRDI